MECYERLNNAFSSWQEDSPASLEQRVENLENNVSNLTTEIENIETELDDKVDTSAFNTDQARQDALEATDRAAIAKIIDSGPKNLLKNTSTSRTSRGITFTVNSDGTVTANGTNDGTGASTLTINTQSSLNLANGNYVLSGCPNVQTDYVIDATRDAGASLKDSGSGVSFTVGGSYVINEFRIVINRSVTVENLVFKPMVCTASDNEFSSEFVPYRPTYQELWEMVQALQG